MNSVLSKIIELVQNHEFYKAEQELNSIYEINANSYDVNKLLGIALIAQKKYNGALKCFEKCYEIKQNDYEVVLNISYLFLKTQFYKQSIEFSKKAIDLDSKKPGAYQNLASCFFFLDRQQEAQENIEKTIDIRGGLKNEHFYNVVDLRRLYGDILLAQKKSKQFCEYILDLLELTYDCNLLTKLHRENPKLIQKKHLDQVKHAIKNSVHYENIVDRNTELSSAHFFLAEYNSKNDPTLSEQHYVKANKYIADMQRESLFIRQKFCLNIHKFFKEFDTTSIINGIDSNKGDGLIFILGMPRSGTSLTESILSTADKLITGGEKAFFTLQLTDKIKKISQEEQNFDLEFFSDLGDRYLDHIKIHRNENKFFVDKLPENYLFYKFIRLSLPGAKFIHCNRDPWDNAISLFKQNYAVNIFYASSFFGIANELANYEHLIQFWKKIDGDQCMLDVKYEKLVQNELEVASEIWKHCDLEGNYDPLKRKKHFAFTASMQQISKEIYLTSLDKKDFDDFRDSFMIDLQTQRDFWKKRLKN